MGATKSKETSKWKSIKHVWGGSCELTYPPNHTIWVLFDDGTEIKCSQNDAIQELKNQGKLNLLSWSHMNPEEREEEKILLDYCRKKQDQTEKS